MTRRKKTIVKLCLLAVMTALFVVLDTLSIRIGDNIKITFGGLPILITALYLGPVSGMITGLMGSFLAQLLSYGFTDTTVLWILPAGIRGLSAGLLLLAFSKPLRPVPLSVTIMVSSLLVTVANTAVMYLDSVIHGYYTFAYVFGATAFRLLSSVLTAFAMMLIIIPVTMALNRQNLISNQWD